MKRAFLAALLISGLSLGLISALQGCEGLVEPKTEVVTLHPFTASGTLKTGYKLHRSTYRTILEYEDADQWVPDASPFGAAPNTYEVGPSSEHAAACWASPTDAKAVLCPVNPWSHTLRVYGVTKRPKTKKPRDPQPYGLVLSDGSRYEARVGGAAAASKNGWSPTYYCFGKCKGGYAVVANEKHSIDRINGRWYVYVGEPVMNKPLKPKRVLVMRALFVG